MLNAIIGQKKKNPVCPIETNVKGKLALITGATSGIGKETARGLLKRGVRTILSARNETKLNELVNEFQAEGITKEMLYTVTFDLGDLKSLDTLESQLEKQIKNEKIEILIENAGVWPKNFETTKQNFEIAFGTNVLGHFALRKILQKKFLSNTAKVVIVTGDIYILEKECTGELKYSGPIGGIKAYCQSKLGNIWIGLELQRRFPDLNVTIVHPGVIATNLGDSGELGMKFKSLFMLSPIEGSQTSLYCATQNTIKGGYYHNTFGLSSFLVGDPAIKMRDANLLWEKLEKILEN
ncbi:MAG: SDR family NAD(P)-dependent oxidoreductase [Leptospiraceae bacterium]|nr:SDR family NAD(P)-dependent oxidoreductase [Leptospiraceae bacterium]